jgi:hypothetical protein
MEDSMKKYKICVSLLFCVLVCTVAVLVDMCTFKSPSAPVWDVNLIVPLINKIYTMIDLADETDNLEIDGQDVVFTIDHDIDPILIGDYLKIDGAENTSSIFIPAGQFPPWVEIEVDTLTMPDSIVVENATIKSGRIEINANNQTNYDVTVRVDIESLSKDGISFSESRDVSPGPYDDGIILDSYAFHPGGTNLVPYTCTVSIKGGNNTQAGNVDVTVRVSEIYFESVTGTFKNLNVDIEEDTTELDIPAEFEGVEIESANLKFTLQFGVQMPIYVDLFIEGADPAVGLPLSLSIQDSITNLVGSGVMIDTLEFPDDNEVADFINSQPEEIVFQGSMRLGKGENTVTIDDTNTIRCTVLFRAPLTLTLPDHVTEPDPDTLEIDQDAQERIRDNLQSAKLEAVVDNHLPFGVRVTMLFDSTRFDSTLYDPDYTPHLVVGPLVVDPARVAGLPGLVIEPRSSELSIDLDKDDLTLFERQEIYQGSRIEFLGTAGQMVKVRPTDYITIKATLNVLVRTKVPEDDDEEEGGES